jgi:hypothetical protein
MRTIAGYGGLKHLQELMDLWLQKRSREKYRS